MPSVEQQLHLPLIEVRELSELDSLVLAYSPILLGGRYFHRLLQVSPPAEQAINPPSGVGAFCNGLSAAPI